jgi:hypothetical protein
MPWFTPFDTSNGELMECANKKTQKVDVQDSKIQSPKMGVQNFIQNFPQDFPFWSASKNQLKNSIN